VSNLFPQYCLAHLLNPFFSFSTSFSKCKKWRNSLIFFNPAINVGACCTVGHHVRPTHYRAEHLSIRWMKCSFWQSHVHMAHPTNLSCAILLHTGRSSTIWLTERHFLRTDPGKISSVSPFFPTEGQYR
jgi:hypothetical protein